MIALSIPRQLIDLDAILRAFGVGSAPKPKPVVVAPPPEPAPVVDENAEAELARQRRDLEGKRKGRRSLRIDPGSADSGSSGPGLRVD